MCGITGAVITMAASLVLPLGAQSQSDGVFGEITCTGITVRHSDSSEHVTLTPSTITIGSSEGLGAHILVSGGTGALSLGERPTFLLGGESSYLAVNGKNGAVIMDVAQHGGSVHMGHERLSHGNAQVKAERSIYGEDISYQSLHKKETNPCSTCGADVLWAATRRFDGRVKTGSGQVWRARY